MRDFSIPVLKWVGKQKISQEYRENLNNTTDEVDPIHLENFVPSK